MTTIVFDTLQYTKRAQEAGFTKTQAEFQAEEIAKMFDGRLATKEDLKIIEADLKAMEESLTLKLTVRMGGMISGGVAILGMMHFFK